MNLIGAALAVCFLIWLGAWCSHLGSQIKIRKLQEELDSATATIAKQRLKYEAEGERIYIRAPEPIAAYVRNGAIVVLGALTYDPERDLLQVCASSNLSIEEVSAILAKSGMQVIA